MWIRRRPALDVKHKCTSETELTVGPDGFRAAGEANGHPVWPSESGSIEAVLEVSQSGAGVCEFGWVGAESLGPGEALAGFVETAGFG